MKMPNKQLAIDDLLTALSNPQRRELLDSLIADSPPDDAEPPGVTVADEMEMYHIHLPKLADYGLINWDRDTNRVTRGPNFEAAAALLEFLANNDGIHQAREVEV